ncbi:hypothetical protein BDW74DRAFT_173144 [Aspergillus multicolor]|uniref:cytochrome b5 reductase family protein n=1 Tax=Aspergillus multicolor TaxID=41759 RepID=UPI003CCCE771
MSQLSKSITILTIASLGAYTSQKYLIGQAHAEAPEPETSAPPVMFRGFRPASLRVQSVETLNHNTKRLRFEYPDKSWASGLHLTSSLLTICWPQESWLPAIRPYTPVSSLHLRGTIDLVIKRYPNGKVSSHLHTLNPGDTIYFLGALPGYRWVTPDKPSKVYLIAGGSGITPLYQLARGILENPHDQSKVHLVYGANTVHDLFLKQELDDLRARFGERLRVDYLVSEGRGSSSSSLSMDEDGEKDGNEALVRYGARVSTGLLGQVFRRDRQPGAAGDEKVVVCGPPGMVEVLVGGGWGSRESGILAELGFGKDRVHVC